MSTGVFGGSRGWRQQEICMKERIDRHKDGSVKAKGHMKEGELEGHWEWFRKDGSKMRSGYFADGKQVGEWATYDATGKVVKVTKFSRCTGADYGSALRSIRDAADGRGSSFAILASYSAARSSSL